MNASRTLVGDLFQLDVRFETPLYQRPYVWTRSRNWEPLWASVEQLATDQLRGSGDDRPYFLGAIVIEHLDRPAASVHTWQIIDGQQRLTTLQLALAQWERLARDLGEAELAELFARLTRNQQLSRNDPDQQFKVWPTNVDRSAFRAVMTNGAASGGLLAEAARYFRDSAERWMRASGVAPREALEALLLAVKRRLDLVEIRLDHTDDAQRIFETLNALGTPLLPGDLVKNYLLRRVPEAEAELLYRTHWKAFEDDAAYWRTPLRPGRQRVTRLDLFLQNYLVVVRRAPVRAAELFADYRAYFEKSGLTPEQELAQFRAHAQAYERFDRLPEREPQSALGIAMRRLQGLEATTIYPLVLEAFLRLPDDQLSRFLAVLESFLVRRMICRLSTRGYNDLFVNALKELATTEFSAAALTAFFLRGREEISRWPSDAELLASWTSNELYKNLRAQRLRVVFDALERVARSSRVEPIVYVGDLTIEHLLPQGWSEANWPLPGDRAPAEAKVRRDHLLHTIGNLTTITQQLNSEQSNSAWPLKSQLLQRHSVSVLNNALPKQWDDAAIEPRALELFKFAMQAWSRPASDHDDDWRSAPVAAPEPDSPDAPDADRHAAYREFLRALLDEMKKLRPDITAAAGGGGPAYYGFPTGRGDARFHWSFAASNRFRVELYIDQGKKSVAPKALFDALHRDRAAIDAAIALPMSWERLEDARASRIATYRDGNVFDNPELYHDLREWGIDAMTRLADVLMPRLPKSDPPTAKATQTTYAEALASAPEEAREVEQRLVDWAERAGHKSAPSKTGRRFETADGTRLFYFYPTANYVEFRLKTLRDVGMNEEADEILATLTRYAGAPRSSQHPSLPSGALIVAWSDFEGVFLRRYVAARREAAARKSNLAP